MGNHALYGFEHGVDYPALTITTGDGNKQPVISNRFHDLLDNGGIYEISVAKSDCQSRVHAQSVDGYDRCM
jgi:hypothetical protein